MDCGGLSLRSPTGGCANGIPLNESTCPPAPITVACVNVTVGVVASCRLPAKGAKGVGVDATVASRQHCMSFRSMLMKHDGIFSVHIVFTPHAMFWPRHVFSVAWVGM